MTSLDYRLFDVQHAVLPTTLPLKRFYEELVKTQAVLNRKHLGWAAVRGTFATASRLLLQGQTNFVRMLWKFSQVYNPDRQYGDHLKEVKYTLSPPRRNRRQNRHRSSSSFMRRQRPCSERP